MTRRTFVRTAMVIVLVAGVAALGATPAGAAPKWSVVSSPSPAGPPIGVLAGVSCSSTKFCFAVGNGDSGVLTERWNGTGWSLVAAPTIGGQSEVEISGVSCISSTSCFAVGDALVETGNTLAVRTLIEHWNGGKWSIIPSPTPSGIGDVHLAGISCANATSCFAVGFVVEGAINQSLFEDPNVDLLIEHWNGTAWSIARGAIPKGAATSLLSGVSCTSARNCVAVGSSDGETNGGALIEHWNGTRWSIVANPQQGPFAKPRLRYRLKPGITTEIVFSGGLNGVSCSGPSRCFAVGNSFSGGGLTERWNGKKWSIVPSPTPVGADGGDLAAVSCTSATDCSAVGDSFSESMSDPFDNGDGAALSEHWNGTAWSIVAQPHGAQFTQLSGVSCPATNNCAAVGDSAFVQRWNGVHWTIAPFTSKTSQSQLISVSCPDLTTCFAVGSYSNGTDTKTLVERNTGGHWKILPSPNPTGSFESVLNHVSCLSATDCTAVGSLADDTSQATLIEHWNGTAWSIVPSPNPAGSDSALFGVTCLSASNCDAVGLDFGESSATTLIEHWDGTAWSIVPSPNPAFGQFSELTDVACSSASNCTAIGYYEAITGTRKLVARTLAEHWNGSSWSMMTTPNPSGQTFSALIGLSCPSATNCSAVGVGQSATGTNAKTLTEHWNGRKWVIVASPNPRTSVAANLTSVSCRGTSSCYAVGSFSTVVGNKTLVEHWNGSSWKVITSPNPGGRSDSGLNGVSCPSRTSCTAVGSYGANDGFFTLIERGN